MTILSCPIRSIRYYNHDTRQLILEIPETGDCRFRAGQYLELILPEKKCPFSIANSPERKGILELHVRPTPDSEDSRAIERLLDSDIRELQVDFPKGDCYLTESPDTPLVLIAASTGITQMKSIIEYLIPRGIDLPLHLYWGVLSDRDLYLNDLFREWSDTHRNFHYIPVVSEPETSPEWQGRTGLVGEAVLEDFQDLSDMTVYVGGGPGMVYATLDAFVARGLPENRMYSDVFSYAPRNSG